MTLSQETIDYLNDRAGLYGGSADDMLRLTPSILDTDQQVITFWEDHDLSHIRSQAHAPELAHDWSNIMAEDAHTNRARGDEDMTIADQLAAHTHNWIDATVIDITPTSHHALP